MSEKEKEKLVKEIEEEESAQEEVEEEVEETAEEEVEAEDVEEEEEEVVEATGKELEKEDVVEEESAEPVGEEDVEEEEEESEEKSPKTSRFFKRQEKKEKVKKEVSRKLKASYEKKLAQKDEEINKVKAEVERWKNEYYKSYADMSNFKKDIEKDYQQIKKYRIEGFVSELVRTLDAFEMALSAEPKNVETKNYLVGFTYVYNQLIETLKKDGVVIIEPKVGDKFDEKVMHCVETVEDEGEENIIKTVSTKGYKLHDHLIRAAMVVVTKHKGTDDEKDGSKEVKQKEKDEIIA